MPHTILVIEDDAKTANLLRLYLEDEGYTVLLRHEGHSGLAAARQKNPDAIILDLMLPNMDGLEICRILRQDGSTPILMLTARTTEEDLLLGLDLGADDYIKKPFSPREVVARIRTVLRRSEKVQKDTVGSLLSVGDLEIDLLGREAFLKGSRLDLTPKEFNLLNTLARTPGRAYSRSELLHEAFGYDYDGSERTIDVHIMNLRKKLEDDPENPETVLTVYGVGYKLGERFRGN